MAESILITEDLQVAITSETFTSRCISVVLSSLDPTALRNGKSVGGLAQVMGLPHWPRINKVGSDVGLSCLSVL